MRITDYQLTITKQKTTMKDLVKVFAVLLAALSCPSCDKGFVSAVEEGKPCVLDVCVGGALEASVGTRAGSGNADEKISSVQIMVFNTGTGQLDGALYKGNLEAYGQWNGTDRIYCTTGPRQVYAIVNSPVNYVEGDSKVSDIGDLKSVMVSLADNGTSRLVMAGASEIRTLTSPEESITVNVDRLCAAVVLKEVTNRMYAPVYRDRVRITGAYLMNVPGVCPLVDDASFTAASLESGKWYARNAEDRSSPVSGLLSASYSGTSAPLEYDRTTQFGTVFYAFPNEIETAASDVWRPSSSYLVVKASIDGKDCVYPVRLGALEGNKRYEVSLVLHRVGGNPDSPYDEIEFSDVIPTLVVTDWADGDPIMQEI